MNFKKVRELELLLCNTKPEKVPEGWFTSEDYSKEFNISQREACRRLRDMIDNFPNKIQFKKFRVKAGLRVMPVYHYCIK